MNAKKQQQGNKKMSNILAFQRPECSDNAEILIGALSHTLVIVEGKTRSGKTYLAQELSGSLKNTVYIDGIQRYMYGALDLTNTLTDTSKLYLIDEPRMLEQKSLTKAVFSLTEAGGTVVFFCQSASDLEADLVGKAGARFQLTKTGDDRALSQVR